MKKTSYLKTLEKALGVKLKFVGADDRGPMNDNWYGSIKKHKMVDKYEVFVTMCHMLLAAGYKARETGSPAQIEFIIGSETVTLSVGPSINVHVSIPPYLSVNPLRNK